MSISEAQRRSWQTAIDHGFHTPQDHGEGFLRDASHAERLALVHSELSEALEELREGVDPKTIYNSYTVEINHVKLKGLTWDEVEDLTGNTPKILGLKGKPEGIGIELADAVIRIMDLAEHAGIDLEKCIQIKQDYNDGREYRHGDKKL